MHSFLPSDNTKPFLLYFEVSTLYIGDFSVFWNLTTGFLFFDYILTRLHLRTSSQHWADLWAAFSLNWLISVIKVEVAVGRTWLADYMTASDCYSLDLKSIFYLYSTVDPPQGHTVNIRAVTQTAAWKNCKSSTVSALFMAQTGSGHWSHYKTILGHKDRNQVTTIHVNTSSHFCFNQFLFPVIFLMCIRKLHFPLQIQEQNTGCQQPFSSCCHGNRGESLLADMCGVWHVSVCSIQASEESVSLIWKVLSAVQRLLRLVRALPHIQQCNSTPLLVLHWN